MDSKAEKRRRLSSLWYGATRTGRSGSSGRSVVSTVSYITYPYSPDFLFFSSPWRHVAIWSNVMLSEVVASLPRIQNPGSQDKHTESPMLAIDSARGCGVGKSVRKWWSAREYEEGDVINAGTTVAMTRPKRCLTVIGDSETVKR
jgi:hypothetical protein